MIHPLDVLFAAMWASYKLRSDDLLRDVTEEVLFVACPSPLRAWLRENRDYVHQIMPSKSSISRLRLPFDCCWTLAWRDHVSKLLESNDVGFALMADSSPMFGRDWFVMQYECIDVREIPNAFDHMMMFNAGELADHRLDEVVELWKVEGACIALIAKG